MDAVVTRVRREMLVVCCCRAAPTVSLPNHYAEYLRLRYGVRRRCHLVTRPLRKTPCVCVYGEVLWYTIMSQAYYVQ